MCFGIMPQYTAGLGITQGDLVASELISGLAHPGGNVTGPTSIAPQLSGKRLELLKAAVPGISRVAVIWNPAGATAPINLEQTQLAAEALALTLYPLEVRDPGELEAAFEVAREYTSGVLIVGAPLMTANMDRIANLALRNRLPSMYQIREFTEAGGLMCYGPNAVALNRRAVYYVDRILKGARPSDLPVEQPMTFDFVVNMKTARELGITFPHEILLQITEVVE
jgi:putative ABC transport system substrate-binding protein